MKKKLSTILLTGTLFLVSVTSAFANELIIPDETEIENWEYEATLRSNPIAQLEGRASRALRLVASDVGCEYSGMGDYGFAWGYTDVKDGNNDAYHYTRVELTSKKYGGVMAEAKEYGFGLVRAETEDVAGAIHYDDAKAYVYWGEK